MKELDNKINKRRFVIKMILGFICIILQPQMKHIFNNENIIMVSNIIFSVLVIYIAFSAEKNFKKISWEGVDSKDIEQRKVVVKIIIAIGTVSAIVLLYIFNYR